jgi:TRAP-type C4-dicarboxylate transport system permease small subunit
MFRSLSNALDTLYRIGAVAAGALLVLLCSLVLFSVASRMFGFFAGGATDVAGYVMATSTFLALAYTFRTQGHIRVALLIQNFHGTRRRVVEILCLAIMATVTSYLAFYMYRLVYDSWDYNERSEGADAILIWIPQLPVAIGAFLLAVSVLHTLVQSIFDYDTINAETSELEGPNEV